MPEGTQRRVRGLDGQIHTFPGDATDDEINAYLANLNPKGAAKADAPIAPMASHATAPSGDGVNPQVNPRVLAARKKIDEMVASPNLGTRGDNNPELRESMARNLRDLANAPQALIGAAKRGELLATLKNAGANMVDRYWNHPRETLEQDPFGAIADVSGATGLVRGGVRALARPVGAASRKLGMELAQGGALASPTADNVVRAVVGAGLGNYMGGAGGAVVGGLGGMHRIARQTITPEMLKALRQPVSKGALATTRTLRGVSKPSWLDALLSASLARQMDDQPEEPQP